MVKDFKVHLARFYGSVVQAWYTALDPEKKGWLSLNEFVRGCKSVGWNEHMKTLFETLDNGKKGTLSLMDLLGIENMKLVTSMTSTLTSKLNLKLTSKLKSMLSSRSMAKS